MALVEFTKYQIIHFAKGRQKIAINQYHKIKS